MVVFRVLSFLHYNCRGAQKAHRAVPNEALYGVLRISRLITWTYLHSFWNIWLSWEVANPRTTTPVFSCIRTFLRTSVSTGFNPLYGFRNLNYCWFRQMEQLLFARTKKEFIFMGFSLPCHPTFACQTFGDCLCTPDALHISNSIRYFWASVSLIPLSDKVVWALRGKPF